MRSGRPTAWQLRPGGLVEAIRADRWCRFTLSAKVRDGLVWLQSGVEVLGALESGGIVRLIPWDRATEVQTRIDELSRRASAEASAAEAMLLLLNRYPRMFVETANRIELPSHAAAHLGVLGGGVLFIARMGHKVELWSVGYYDDRIAEAATLAADLP